MRALVLTVLLLTYADAAHGQTLLIDPPEEQRVSLALGWDPIWVVELGYAVPVGPWGPQPVELLASLTLPVAALGGLNLKLNAGVAALFEVHEGFGVGSAIFSGMTLTSDPTGRKLAVPLQLNVQPGYFAERWYVALDLAWRAALTTYVWHADAIEALYDDRYPGAGPNEAGPRNGWYALPANRLRLGVVGQLMIANGFGVFANGGFEYTPQAQGIVMNGELGQVPFYALFGGYFRW
jgi:hypothetical protein